MTWIFEFKVAKPFQPFPFASLPLGECGSLCHLLLSLPNRAEDLWVYHVYCVQYRARYTVSAQIGSSCDITIVAAVHSSPLTAPDTWHTFSSWDTLQAHRTIVRLLEETQAGVMTVIMIMTIQGGTIKFEALINCLPCISLFSPLDSPMDSTREVLRTLTIAPSCLPANSFSISLCAHWLPVHIL